MILARMGLEIPFWLQDHDRLFRINYGPMTLQEVRDFQTKHWNIPEYSYFSSYYTGPPDDLFERRRVSLLDRALAITLANSIFKGNLGITLNSLYWTGHSKEKAFLGYRLSCQILPLLGVEDFVLIFLWFNGRTIGARNSDELFPRPPMAMVVHDLLEIISYVELFPTETAGEKISVMVTELLGARCLLIDHLTLFAGRRSRRYTGVLLKILSGVALDSSRDQSHGIKLAMDWENDSDPELSSSDVTLQQLLFFPNEPPVSSAAMDPSLSIDDLDAEFIESGPFKFIPTKHFRQHLTLDRSNRIRIYFDEPSRPLHPSHFQRLWEGSKDSFQTYFAGHVLGKLPHCSQSSLS
jgi:hypothetical protein